ncbi:MAG: hypothetical protein GXP40_12180 [Chloroflexi bacterium]|nr:hypothetical protein [Chloroflexota bacterium]
MNQLVNRYSAVWLAIILVIIVGVLLLRKEPKWGEFAALGVIVVGLLAAWLALRPTQTALMGEAGQVQALIGQGTPVLLEFQSPY